MSSRPSAPPRFSPAVSRRVFLARTGLATAAVFIVPARILGLGGEAPPSSKLNLACIGVNGRGWDNISGLRSQNLIGLCDVDESRADKARKEFPAAQYFQDFREMLLTMEKQIDAVVVSTPDHTHAVAAMMAMRMKKPVYCEKPLAHSLYEVRQLTEAARKYKVPTQLGNQGHSSNSIRQFVEIVRAGAIGAIREVQVYAENAYRPRRYRVRPTETPPVPASLKWDWWLGPAQERPYHPAYHPGSWRSWVDFGTGILGDWTCHTLDPSYWALELDAPTSVVAHAEEYDDPAVRAETFPPKAVIEYEFPARGKRPPVVVKWFFGQKAPRPAELGPKDEMPGIGAVIIGDKGKLMHGSHGAGQTQILPDDLSDGYQRPAPSLPRSKGHYEDWIAACQGGPAASSNWDYGGPLTEVALVGVLALRFKGQKLKWDSRALKVTNHAEAQKLINPPYRKNWRL